MSTTHAAKKAFGRRHLALIVVLGSMASMIVSQVTPTAAGAATSNGTPRPTHAFAGYTAYPSGVTTVSGVITVPTISCTTPKPQDLVSLIEISGSTMIAQAGVNADCQKGSPIYSAGGAAGLVTFHIPVSPGDLVSVTASESPSGTSVTETDTTSSLSSSASAPGATATRVILGNMYNRQSVSIPTFTTVSFSSAMVDGAALGSVSPTSSDMRGKHRVLLVSTGALSPDGTAFTTTFVAN